MVRLDDEFGVPCLQQSCQERLVTLDLDGFDEEVVFEQLLKASCSASVAPAQY